VFVGRTLLDLGSRQHGSDMIEPAALGRPVIVGAFTGNFAEPMAQFRAAKAMIEVGTAAELSEAIAELLGNPAGAREMGERARGVVRARQGATARHMEVILRQMKGTGLA
jgi:3-deoxy-D-manno-octulosonic-acid transferase